MRQIQPKSNKVKGGIPKSYHSYIKEINELENDFKGLTSVELRKKNLQLQNEYKETKNLENLICSSFALTREASIRTLGLRHFDVQLMGGLVLNNNKIAEMKTGEGKTLVAALSASLNALTKKGVHIITVNDYLANRDQVSMGQIFRFLGFDTGLIQSSMKQNQRKENYQSDITYVTNYELTFDYLRDNTSLNIDNIVLRPFNFCIIDEVDSILVDEAQTPIILANTTNNISVEKFITASEIINYLEFNLHYVVDEKNKTVNLTELGNQQVEQIIDSQDLYDAKDPWIPYIINALKAYSLFFNNIHYIIQNNRIIIVDEFTGRIMPDRRWGNGLHQAIEAKEKLPIRPKTRTQASITYQNFFLMYPNFSGMTGTGKTSHIEFEKIYKLKVEVVPTFRPSLRLDLPDLLYKDQFSKWNDIARLSQNISSTGQPLLIGTTTVEKSDMLAELLNEYKLPYEILNAKPENARRESEIVAQAGKKRSITIATNMAGRGTDIILGGNINFQVQKDLFNILVSIKVKLEITKIKKLSKFKNKNQRYFRYQIIKNIQKLKTILKGGSQKLFSVVIILLINVNFSKLSDVDILRILQENNRVAIPTISYQCAIRFLLNDLIFFAKKHHKQENQIVKNLGGLFVIGTEHNDSRRIDDQLRGRCGRQGDPGTTRFFLSLDDNLLRLFSSQETETFLKNRILANSPIESKIITQSLNQAQQQVEERAYQQRKNLFDYDEILDQQRNIIYLERRLVLESLVVRKTAITYAEQFIYQIIRLWEKKEITLRQIIKLFEILFDQSISINLLKEGHFKSSEYDVIELRTYLFQEFWSKYRSKINQFNVYGNGNTIFKNFERRTILLNINNVWQEHLERITLLREAVSWRGYGQKNPLTEYKREAFLLFRQRMQELTFFTLYNIFQTMLI